MAVNLLWCTDKLDASAQEIIDWYRSRGRDPRTKLLVFSDGLSDGDIVDIHRHFRDRIRVSFGWGTKLTNDFAGLSPRLGALSLVAKVTRVDGRPAVKLSDNPSKATGDPAEVERYKRVFGVAGAISRPVEV